MEETKRKPDVVYVPQGYRPDLPLKAISDECKTILGSQPHYHKVNGVDRLFHTRPATGEPMYFAVTHPRAGTPRFLFQDRGDGVLYGYGVAGAYETAAVAPPPAFFAAAAEQAQQHRDALAAYLAGGDRPDTTPKPQGA